MSNQINQNIREPKQNRSIDKKNRIIEAGLELFKGKGYHNTNTAEIALRAGVSTGTVYSYFENKKAILMESLDFYYGKIFSPIAELIKSTSTQGDLHDFLDSLLDLSAELHRDGQSLHEEMTALAYTDEDISSFFSNFEVNSITKIKGILDSFGIKTDNVNEKVLITLNLFESFCHESAFHQHSFINYEVMKNELIKIIAGMFEI